MLAKIVKVEEHRQTDVRKREIDKSEKSKDFLDNKEKDKKLAPYNRKITYDSRSDYTDKNNVLTKNLMRQQTTTYKRMSKEIEKNIFKLEKMNSRPVGILGSAKVKIHNKKKQKKGLKRSRSMGGRKQDDEQMSIPGQFILYFCANIFLSSDFEYCLRITLKNFSFVENTSLFEANILRFRSLAAEQLFDQKDKTTIREHDIFRNLTNLFTALESAENAKIIYETRKDDMGGK